MDKYKNEFIEFLIESNALTFGDFTAKSGRKTPFFINMGSLCSGIALHRLGEFYAEAISKAFAGSFNVLYGPAYKGIPLAAVSSIYLSMLGIDVSYCSNRKETKDHGEGGGLLGAPLGAGSKVLIIEDVITAGTSIRESVPIIEAYGAGAVGLIVGVDRMERGSFGQNALIEVSEAFGFASASIASAYDIVSYLKSHPESLGSDYEACMDRMASYYKEYGTSEMPF